jgi:hypothetical protein
VAFSFARLSCNQTIETRKAAEHAEKDEFVQPQMDADERRSGRQSEAKEGGGHLNH